MIARRALLAGLAATAVVAAGCSGANNSAENGFTGGDGSYTHIPVDERQPAPALTGPTLDGKTLSTSDYTDTVLVLNVWGSWCAPCRHEAPHLVEAAAKLDGVAQFVGINTRDLDTAPAQAFVRAFEVTYPNLFDPDGALLLGFGQVPPKAIPSTLIIDRQGRVAARILGEVTSTTLVAAVEDIAEGT